MSTRYVIDCSITPLCTACGGELEIAMTESKKPFSPFDLDNPHERKDRRVFVNVCDKCFVFRKSHPALSLLLRIHADADSQYDGSSNNGQAKFSAELMMELSTFVEEMQK